MTCANTQKGLTSDTSLAALGLSSSPPRAKTDFFAEELAELCVCYILI